VAYKRKLIEVAIPLAAINEQSAREKSIRQGHPSTLHLWWARRPLATARAVLFAQLVDDPSERADEFRAEVAEAGETNIEAAVARRIVTERERLFDLMTRMVDWDNLHDDELFDDIRAEILRSTDGNPPPILDPFAGGGTIPLEAQRLGLDAYASDLNPVAVLINKALIEIPPKFSEREPVFPDAAAQRIGWTKASGLAEDVRRYGTWMRDEAERRVGHLYPKAVLSDGSGANVVAWIWARTIKCPNPACGIEMPLVRSWWLAKKKGREAFVVPLVTPASPGAPASVTYEIGRGKSGPATEGTMSGRMGAICVSCGAVAPLTYIKSEGMSSRIGVSLLAVVAESARSRVYIAPTEDHSRARDIGRPASVPDARLSTNSQYMGPPFYGLSTFADLFTNRQLTAMTTFSDLVIEARERVQVDALDAGMLEGSRLDEGGDGAAAYADAVATYLGMGVSRLSDIANSLTRWENTREQVRNLFGRQAIPMIWDFAETPPFGKAAGSFEVSLGNLSKSIRAVGEKPGHATQADAASRKYQGFVVSTDPPYYDNVPYADISDFFYVWLRRSLHGIHPSLLGTVLVPKSEELVANPQRQGGKVGAKQFFETGFEHVFAHARENASGDFPITVFYAFKQTESDSGGTASTGWETILASMIRSGWTVTATWPVRSELSNRMRGMGSNALASSVVLALRPRPTGAPTTDRRGFIAALKRELAPSLRDLQLGGIAPVDLPQAAIGPGMAVFSRYSAVIESDGSPMPVRAALSRINDVLDEVLAEQEGDFDPVTRFALAWYRGHGYEAAAFGEAEDLARARGTAVSKLERSGVLTARAGRVRLYRPDDLPERYDVLADTDTSAWEALHHSIRVLQHDGMPAVGAFLLRASRRDDGAVDLDLVKELAYLLYQVAEKSGRTRDALSFNDIATSWGEILRSEHSADALDTAVTLDIGEDD